MVQPNRALHAALITRLKIMAELDIAEKRLPQDGRISLRIGGRAIDVRVSTLPSAHGERAVLRLLDKSESKFTLEGLGMSGDVLKSLRALIHQPHGIVLVTGPTGSGKTTTLYASLGRIDTSTTNILTVEDPIEYELPGIGQTQVNTQDRPDLRQGAARDPAPGPGRHHDRRDPRLRDRADRDPGLAHRPPGAGHAAHQRRAQRGDAADRHGGRAVPAQLQSLLGVLAQRLVRKLCPICRRQDERGRWHPVGCGACGHTGYKGRTGVYELMVADDKVRALIHNRAAESQLFVAAEAAGLRSMREDGERLVDEGITSPEEVMRVTRD